MNKSTSNSTSSAIDSIDITVRLLFLFVHILYFITVFLSKELKKCSYINLHQINLVGLIVSINFCLWINNATPTSQLCSVSEAVWAICRFARFYSVLSLALHRFITVKWKALSVKWSLISIGVVWLLSLGLFLVIKHSAQVGSGKKN